MGGRANLQVVEEAILAVRATGLITVGIRESGQLDGQNEEEQLSLCRSLLVLQQTPLLREIFTRDGCGVQTGDSFSV